ncbi:hypothetical protein C5167_014193 [Papaver somniferum]|uniref:Uncharacterized protein n=1 Tax=Papaver somniferum TaxID=3469 RepID=A0A4Y7J5K7_PAPSO|nr:hypothetical protein C5167_014193 [Papaver somniferum]
MVEGQRDELQFLFDRHAEEKRKMLVVVLELQGTTVIVAGPEIRTAKSIPQRTRTAPYLFVETPQRRALSLQHIFHLHTPTIHDHHFIHLSSIQHQSVHSISSSR